MASLLHQPNQPVTNPTSSSLAPPKLFKPSSVQPKKLDALPLVGELGISLGQCNKAINALITFVNKKGLEASNDLLQESEEKVYLIIGLKKSAIREQHKPIQLSLPHPVMDPKSSTVTLFVKDPQREYKDLLESTNIKFISRVVGLDKLRNKHKTFEAKRLLMKESELFLVDDRVMTEVGKALGKQFREAKKQPVTVSLVRKDLKGELERAVSSTYLLINTGTSLAVKIGTTALHSPTELYDNLLAVLPQLAVRLPHGGFGNIQSLHVKTTTSISLPIYNTSLDIAGRFSGPSAEDVTAVEGKAAEKLVIREAKEEKIRVREARRIEREVEKEKREKSQKEGGSKERKERKRKAAEASEADSSIGGSILGGKDVIEEETLALDAPILDKKVVKKSKKIVEASVETEGEMAAPAAKAKKVKKVKA